MRTGMGSLFRVVQVGSGGTSGVVSYDSKIFRLDNLEFEVAEGACGAPDRPTDRTYSGFEMSLKCENAVKELYMPDDLQVHHPRCVFMQMMVGGSDKTQLLYDRDLLVLLRGTAYYWCSTSSR